MDMRRILLFIPLLAVPPLICGCLTTLAVSAVAGSGVGGEQVETARQTARDVAAGACDTAGNIAESAQDFFECWGSD
jgi:hypothetical protein